MNILKKVAGMILGSALIVTAFIGFSQTASASSYNTNYGPIAYAPVDNYNVGYDDGYYDGYYGTDNYNGYEYTYEEGYNAGYQEGYDAYLNDYYDSYSNYNWVNDYGYYYNINPNWNEF